MCAVTHKLFYIENKSTLRKCTLYKLWGSVDIIMKYILSFTDVRTMGILV